MPTSAATTRHSAPSTTATARRSCSSAASSRSTNCTCRTSARSRPPTARRRCRGSTAPIAARRWSSAPCRRHAPWPARVAAPSSTPATATSPSCRSAAARQSISPRIPLGSRGEWAGQPHDVIGFQQRSVTVEGQRYAWDEYVLFNPYVGFRYLTEYNGHWNDVTTVRELPALDSGGTRAGMRLGDDALHALPARDRTHRLRPRRVPVARAGRRGGDHRRLRRTALHAVGRGHRRRADLVARHLHRPSADLGGLPGAGHATGRRSACSPTSPIRTPRSPRALWRAFRWLAVLVVVLLLYRMITGGQRDHLLRTVHVPAGRAGVVVRHASPSRSRATARWTSRSRRSLSNSWLGFDVALINLETGDAHNTDTEISYYHGVESGESWSEGNTKATMSLPRLPAGQYYLRVEPEGPPNGPQRAVQDPRAPRRARLLPVPAGAGAADAAADLDLVPQGRLRGAPQRRERLRARPRTTMMMTTMTMSSGRRW